MAQINMQRSPFLSKTAMTKAISHPKADSSIRKSALATRSTSSQIKSVSFPLNLVSPDEQYVSRFEREKESMLREMLSKSEERANLYFNQMNDCNKKLVQSLERENYAKDKLIQCLLSKISNTSSPQFNFANQQPEIKSQPIL